MTEPACSSVNSQVPTRAVIYPNICFFKFYDVGLFSESSLLHLTGLLTCSVLGKIIVVFNKYKQWRFVL